MESKCHENFLPRDWGNFLHNNFHLLQALRHMYALAAEKRLLVPIDVSTRRPCYARVTVQYSRQNNTEQGAVVSMTAPCLIPEPRRLKTVS